MALPACSSRSRTGSPRFLVSPSAHATLLDPGGISTPGPPRRVDAAFRCVKGVGSPGRSALGAESRGLHNRCLRFAAWVAPAPRKTRFRLVANLCRAGLSPAGLLRRFLKWLCHLVPLPQAFPGAITPGISCNAPTPYSPPPGLVSFIPLLGGVYVRLASFRMPAMTTRSHTT